MNHISQRFLSTTCLSAAAVVMTLGLASGVLANPQGGVVSAGSATISSSGNKLNVVQSSNRAVIDWTGFDIAAGEHTQFYQPNSGSIAVNRIGSGNASVIAGQLSANGRIVIVNPNGVMFTGTSVVDVAGLVASTSNISNDNVMAGGKLIFDQPGNPNASIINNGSITVREAGLVGFVAPNVINNGIINAELGTVHLASGDKATVDFYGDGLINLAVSDAVTSQLVSNTGTISANGGTIALTAAAGKEIVNSVVNVEGVLESQSVSSKNGTIILAAEGSNAVEGNIAANKGKKSGTSTVLVNAKLDVSGKKAGERGGKVTITGDHVALLDHAVIDASGANGGGIVHVGGEYLGRGTTSTAEALFMGGGARIDASALTQGNGGEVILFADKNTIFGGSIDASGAGEHGNGGFVETSGKHTLQALGDVRILAGHNGTAGTWLMDPADITITAATNTNIGGAPNFAATGTGSQVSAASIQSNLDAGTNVTILTSNDGFAGNGDIFVNSAISTSNSGTGSLTLSAFRNIDVNANITLHGGDLTLGANNTGGAGGGAITVTNATLTTNGGDIVMGGGLNPHTVSTVGNSVDQDGIKLTDATLNAGGGDITLLGTSWSDATAGYRRGIFVERSTLQTSGSGNITLNGTGGSLGNWSEGIDIVDSSILTTAGNILISGRAGNARGGSYGLDIYSSYPTPGNVLIESTSGNITLNGTGGTNVDFSVGFYMAGAWDGVHTSTVRTGNGVITINGTGGSGSSYESGILFDGDTIVEATGTGNIIINGTGGNGTNSDGNNYGVGMSRDGSSQQAIRTNTGSISITGTGNGMGAYDNGILMVGGSSVYSTGGGALTLTGTGANGSAGIATSSNWDAHANAIGNGSSGAITLIADTLSFANQTIQTSGLLTLKPLTAGTTMGVGVGAGTLNITDALLSTFSYGALKLGGTTAGVTHINSGTTFAQPLTVENGSGDIFVDGAINTSGTADVTLSAFRNVDVNANITLHGGDLTLGANNTGGVGGGAVTVTNATLTTNGGDITMGGGLNPHTTAAVGNSVHQDGIKLSGSTLNAGGGDISLRGTAWSNAAAVNRGGIWIDRSTLQTSGNGDVTLMGVSGAGGAGGWSDGIKFFGSTILAATGDILVSGIVDDNATNYSGGINISSYNDASNRIETTSGNITFNGTGGANVTGSYGFWLGGAWDGVHFSTVRTDSGTITVNGTGGGGSAYQVGAYFDGESIVEATGTGNIVINGTGGNGTAGGSYSFGSTGVSISRDNSSQQAIHTNTGSITINGIGNGAGTYNTGIYMSGGASVYSTGGGAISLTGTGANGAPGIVTDNAWDSHANTIGNGTAGAITLISDKLDLTNQTIQTSGLLNLKPLTAGTTMGVGAGAGTLNITDALLSTFSYGALKLGGSNTGTAHINSGTNFAQPVTVQTGSGYDIVLDAALNSSASGTAFTFAPGRNFINASGSATPFTFTGGGRWLVYGANPTSNTLGGMTSSFQRFSCTYAGACPSFAGETGNGFLYSSAAPAAPVSSPAVNSSVSKLIHAPNFTAIRTVSIPADTIFAGSSGQKQIVTSSTSSAAQPDAQPASNLFITVTPELKQWLEGYIAI